MKKLLVMILMLGVSGSVFAIDITYECKIHGGLSKFEFKDDYQKVNGYSNCPDRTGINPSDTFYCEEARRRGDIITIYTGGNGTSETTYKLDTSENRISWKYDDGSGNSGQCRKQ